MMRMSPNLMRSLRLAVIAGVLVRLGVRLLVLSGLLVRVGVRLLALGIVVRPLVLGLVVLLVV